MVRTDALRVEEDQAVATTPVELKSMVGEHQGWSTQSSSPENTRGPVYVLLAPQVVPSWVT